MKARTAGRLAGPAWVMAFAAIWASAAIFLGLGILTTYVVAYGWLWPVALVRSPDTAVIMLAAAVVAFAAVAVSVRWLRAPSVVWVGVPLGQLLVFACVWATVWLRGYYLVPQLAASFARSDLLIGLAATAAAFVGSRVAVAGVPNQRIEQTART